MKNEDASIPISFRFNLKHRSPAENERVANILLKLKKEKKLSTELNRCIDTTYFKTQSALVDLKTQTIDEKLQVLLQIFSSTKEKEEKELLLNMFTVYYKDDIAKLVASPTVVATPRQSSPTAVAIPVQYHREANPIQSSTAVVSQGISAPLQVVSEKPEGNILVTTTPTVKKEYSQIISRQPETKPVMDDDDDEFSQLPNPYEKQK